METLQNIEKLERKQDGSTEAKEREKGGREKRKEGGETDRKGGVKIRRKDEPYCNRPKIGSSRPWKVHCK